nr:M23 family metallopeptidase [uncultured Aminipila sp.]
MAKFFKEDLDKTQKKKNKRKHKPGGLIADLNNLGADKEDTFLKGFPKTPAEIAQEEADAQARTQVLARAAEEAARLQEEENKKALEEAEAQAARYKGQEELNAILAAEKMQSGQVKTKKEKFGTGKTTILDKTMELMTSAEHGFVEFCRTFCETIMHLGHCAQDEIVSSVVSVIGGIKAVKNAGRDKINTYYKENPEKRRERHQKNRKLMRQFIQTKNNLIAKEKATAAKMVRFINHVDTKNEQLADKTTVIVTEGNKKFNFAREWAEINKRKLLLHFGVVIVIAICCVAVFNYCTAYEYSYNGRTLGMVKKQEDVLKIVDIVSQQLSKEHNAEINIDKEQDIAFKRVVAINKDIDDTEAVLKRLTYMKNMNATAYGIYVNDIRVAIVDSKKTAKDILDNIQAMYLVTSGDIDYKKVSFKEKVMLKEIDTKLGRIQNIDTVMQKLLTGAISQQVHIVATGDTLSGIARTYGMSISELREANPTINPEKLSIGQQIVLTKPAPMVTVQTLEIANYLEPIAYQTEYKDTNTLYKGETNTEVQGIDGECSVTARITRQNGVQVAATVLSSETTLEPTTAVILRGTKERPSTVGTGNLRYPVSSFRLTSKFGPRWGRMHYGLDLACPIGTRVSAADGGTVIFSGYSGSLGYVVKINHGNGMVTFYAHCSKLLVKKGDKVYQGQQIANSGNTGRSTGPHCHFQVEINGVPKNPLNYL